jgi:outer membrane immunogenic protein
MKRILFTTVSLGVLGLMSPALGADLPMKAPVAVSPMYDWSGFYVGAYGGGGFGNHNLNNALGPVGFANFTINYDSTGGIGGGEIGYNVQSGNIVVGVEADGFWSGIKGSDSSQFFSPTPLNANVVSIDTTKLRDGASFRARGGIAIDRLLLFFDGGWALGDLSHTNVNPGVGTDAFTVHRSGLAAGGGIAYAITNNILGKLEYRYYDFGRFVRNNPLNGVLPYTVDSTYSVVTVGFDYKFGGPVVAKY